MTNDPVAVHARFAAGRQIAYTLLADEKSAIIKAFGVIDQRYPATSRWHGLAVPIIFVIDAGGVVTHRFSSRDYRDRPSIDSVLEALRNRARVPAG